VVPPAGEYNGVSVYALPLDVKNAGRSEVAERNPITIEQGWKNVCFYIIISAKVNVVNVGGD